MEREPSVAEVNVAGATGLAGVRCEIEREVTGRSLQRARRNLIGDDVHQAADRIGAVQQRRRSAHDFDSLGRRRVQRHAVIAGLTREVADALAVLQHRDAVAVETTNDRTRRTRAEATASPRRAPDCSVAPRVASSCFCSS